MSQNPLITYQLRSKHFPGFSRRLKTSLNIGFYAAGDIKVLIFVSVHDIFTTKTVAKTYDGVLLIVYVKRVHFFIGSHYL